ncbi:MAG: DUF2183 domain-containing protein [Trueperella sp.]|nr:DUF2183 domain-containing protein [Trueperella sp.]
MALSIIARSIEDRVNRRSIVRRKNQGWIPKLIAYAGYGSTESAKVLARAVMRNPKDITNQFTMPYLPPNAHSVTEVALQELSNYAREMGNNAQRGWRQFFDTQVGFLPVTVRLGKREIHTRTDRAGYVDLLIDGHGLPPGWHKAVIIPLVGQPVTAPVMIVDPAATHGLISDIDDTIVVTWLPRIALAAWNSFVLNTNARSAVPGMPDFYWHLLSGHADAPVFYLSTGAWNTYSAMSRFINANGLPFGPLLLTDWGSTATRAFRSGPEHKKTQLRNLLIMFPHIKWYLIGDDGQHDLVIYDELAREHPQRVRGIAIRQLNPVEQVLSHGTTEVNEAARKDADIERHGVPIIRGRDGFALLSESLRASSRRNHRV